MTEADSLNARARVRTSDGKEFETFLGPGMRIGRRPECDIVVDDPSVSGFHARVVEDERHLYIEDLGSSNGLRRGSTRERVERCSIIAHEPYWLGNAQVLVEYLGRGAGARPEKVADTPSSAKGEAPPSVYESLNSTLPSLIRPRLLALTESGVKSFPLEFSYRNTTLECVLGRNKSEHSVADTALLHPAISSPHARIIFESQEFFIEDLGSRNGTYIDNEPLEPRVRRKLAPDSQLGFSTEFFALFIADQNGRGQMYDLDYYRQVVDQLHTENKVTDETLAKLRDLGPRGIHAGEWLVTNGQLSLKAWSEANRNRRRRITLEFDPVVVALCASLLFWVGLTIYAKSTQSGWLESIANWLFGAK